MNFELKFKYIYELEFDLISNRICEFDSIQDLTMRIKVQIGVSNIRDVTRMTWLSLCIVRIYA
jgi:hypothetical protein